MSRETEKRARRIINLVTPKVAPIAAEMILPNTSGDHVRSIKRATPVGDKDLVNKEYVDDSVAAAGGHVILDGTIHTDSVADGVTRGSIIIGNATPKWDELVVGAAGKVLTSDGTDVSWGVNLDATAHVADNTQAHSDYLLNSGADIAVGPITITADNSSADTAYVPMVLYNTDATPPAASGFPVGTLYVQYTA